MSIKKRVVILALFTLLLTYSVSAFTLQECTDDSDCSSGYTCVESYDSEHVCVENSYVCETTDDCITNLGSGYACSEVWNYCSEDTDGDGVADIDLESFCEDSSCGEYVCQNSYDCYSSCTDATACASGYACSDDGYCETDTDGDGVVDECYYSSDCADGEVCNDGTCEAYCAIGEADCSDGEDDDGDGLIDYWGVCYDGTTLVDCTDALDADDCYTNYCDATQQATYIEEDDDCVSPLDTSEEDDGPTYGAPEDVEESFFVRLWNWIVFWN